MSDSDFRIGDLNALIADLFGARVDPVGDQSVSFFDLGLDSLDISSIYLVIERRFGFEIAEADMDGLDTPERLIAYVGRRRVP
ncbi:MAG: acyl carrier protein [Rhodospirillales bacterium]|nr:acyl carrier protein [Rhodospirillales bacterium]